MTKYNIQHIEIMSKLLIPIDFSEYSAVAVEYACQIAQESGQSLDLLHVFADHTNIYINAQNDPSLKDPRVPMAERDMKNIIAEIEKNYPSVQSTAIFRDGNLYDEIKKITNAESYDAVVMGTKGSSGMEAIFIGSNTYDTILNTRTPLLAVPLDATKLKKNRVALLCNFKDAELTCLSQSFPLFKKDFELVLIHVNVKDREIKDIDADFKNFINRIENELGISDITYIIKPQSLFMRQKESVAQAVTSVLIDEQVDILLLTKSRKSVFRQLTESNVVKKLAFDIKLPTFFARVLPQKD